MAEDPKPQQPGVAKKLSDLIAEELSKGHDKVNTRVKDKLIDKELESRSELVMKGLTKRDDLQKAFDDIKPDQVALDGSGKVVSETWSKYQLEKHTKAKEQLEKAVTALDLAIGEGHYDCLKQVLGCGTCCKH